MAFENKQHIRVSSPRPCINYLLIKLGQYITHITSMPHENAVMISHTSSKEMMWYYASADSEIVLAVAN